jgi:hypothetical protein
MRSQKDANPLYLFDGNLEARAPDLLEDWKTPHYFSKDYYSKLKTDDRPPWRWLIIGPARTGAPVSFSFRSLINTFTLWYTWWWCNYNDHDEHDGDDGDDDDNYAGDDGDVHDDVNNDDDGGDDDVHNSVNNNDNGDVHDSDVQMMMMMMKKISSTPMVCCT